MKLNSNISTLFKSLGSNNLSGIDLSEYSLIKKGAYKKALKAYYAEDKKDTSVKKTDNTKDTKTDKSVSSQLRDVKTKADSLSDSLSVLSGTDLWKNTDSTDKDVVKNALKDFTSSYNALISQDINVNSTEIKAQKSYISSMTQTLSKTLNKSGIEINAKGEMSLNEKTFDAVSLDTVKKLFTEKNNYGSQIKGYADAISKAAVNSSSLYNNSGNSIPGIESLFNSTI